MPLLVWGPLCSYNPSFLELNTHRTGEIPAHNSEGPPNLWYAKLVWERPAEAASATMHGFAVRRCRLTSG